MVGRLRQRYSIMPLGMNSFISRRRPLFAIGAVIPVIPYGLLEGQAALWTSVVASAFGLFGIGALITLMTGRSVWFSGLRQLLFGLVAAALTYGVGHLIGVSLAG